jgi:hypothetical protein
MTWTPTKIVTAIASALQIVGVLVVVWEAWRLRRLFSIASSPILLRGFQFVRQKWPFRRRRLITVSAGDSALVIEGAAVASVTPFRPDSMAIKDRVARLEFEAVMLQSELAKHASEQDQRHRDLLRRLEETDERISRDVRGIHERMETASGVREPLHVWGVEAIIVGLLLSIAPDWVVSVWQWESWWMRMVTIVVLVAMLAGVPGT